MILIADSGSTKTQWYLTNNDQIFTFDTIGYNPIILSTVEIKRSLEGSFIPQVSKYIDKIKTIYFYGAGCSSTLAQSELKSCLSPIFHEGTTISVKSDLWACIYASCGLNKGICSILGTGSNACVYEGGEIVDQLPSLGFILGDEGSGGQIGKRLVYHYFYRELPTHLAQLFEAKYEIEEHQFVKKLYSDLRPNQFLASFANFAVEHRKDSFIQKLLKDCFDSFVKAHLLKFEQAKQLPIHFVGSVAFGFREELEEVMIRHQLRLGKVLKTPFPDLLDYHLALNLDI